MRKVIPIILAVIASLPVFAEQPGLERLKEGNKRFVEDMRKNPNTTPERRKEVASGQNPFAIIVGCADSRVAPEIIFDQGVGDLFVVRVAGNVVGPIELESVNFAAQHLGSSVILVLGHERCGAIDAVIQGAAGDIQSIAALIKPAVKQAKKLHPKDLLRVSTMINAIRIRDYLLTVPAIKKLVAAQKLEVHAGYYNLKTGAVELLTANGSAAG